MLGLWSEALALDHAGLGDEGTRFRDDALALAQATEPALLPRLGAQGRPVVGPPPPPRPDPDLPLLAEARALRRRLTAGG